MGFGIYSPEGLRDYIPNANLTVPVGQTMNWYLTLTNDMGSAQFVQIVVRMGNLTTPSPNATTPLTGYAPLLSLQQFVGDGETTKIPFTWNLQVVNESANNSTVFLAMLVNGQAVSSEPIFALHGQNFRLIFELWTFNSETNGFLYGYGSSSSRTGCWLQVWFNA